MWNWPFCCKRFHEENDYNTLWYQENTWVCVHPHEHCWPYVWLSKHHPNEGKWGMHLHLDPTKVMVLFSRRRNYTNNGIEHCFFTDNSYLRPSIWCTLIYHNFGKFAKLSKVFMFLQHLCICKSLWKANHKHQVFLYNPVWWRKKIKTAFSHCPLFSGQ